MSNNAFPSLVIGLLLTLAGTMLILAEEVPQKVNKDRPKAEVTDVGPIRSGRSFLGASVEDARGQLVGKVQDLVLDIGAGRVSDFLISSGGEESRTSAGKIPWQRVRISPESGRISLRESNVRSKTESDVSRSAVATNPDHETILLSSLPARRIDNREGNQLGKIDDVAVAMESGQIAYVVVVMDGARRVDHLFPIPLPAFVAKTAAEPWQIELPVDVVTDTPTFRRDQWPTSVPAAWSEYVHVRYGRSPFGGVQRRPQAKPNQ